MRSDPFKHGGQECAEFSSVTHILAVPGHDPRSAHEAVMESIEARPLASTKWKIEPGLNRLACRE